MPGEVTAESLSDPDSGYVVVSVPEGLDQTQGEVVVAYVAFDKAAWRAYRAMDGDHSAVEAAATGQARACQCFCVSGFGQRWGLIRSG